MFTIENLAFPISIKQQDDGLFTVTYGKQVRDGLTYNQAAKEIGFSVLHVMACESIIEQGE